MWNIALIGDQSWRAKRGIAAYDGYWEHDKAVDELRRSRSPALFSALSPLQRPLGDLMDRIWEEVRKYRLHVNRVAEINDALTRISKAMAQVETSVKADVARLMVKEPFQFLTNQLSDLGSRSTHSCRSYWSGFYLGNAMELRVATLNNPTQERHLDALFQVLVGKQLRTVYADMTLYTISRLVLLAYICSGLAVDSDGQLIIVGSKPARDLKVERTYETLRNAGLR